MWRVGAATKEMKRLGLVGGIGTLAGVSLVWRVVQQCANEGAWRDADYPQFVYFNIPTGGTDQFGCITDISEISHALQHASDAHCEVALVLCNTAHLYFDILAKRFSGELLNMVEMGTSTARGRVAVLQSRVAAQSGLYSKSLENRGCEFVPLSEPQQSLIDRMIGDCMGYRKMEVLPVMFHELQADLWKQGVQQIIVGCTELSMIPVQPNASWSVVDAGYLAIDKAVRLCRK